VLLVCIASTLGSFLLLAFAQSMTAVFLSRVLDGILGGNIALAQAYITGKWSLPPRFRCA
jgi:DHA1 family tetracycline resistance protein-like MFS transporter